MNLTNRLSESLLSPPVKQQQIWNHKTYILHNDCYIQLCVYLHCTKEISLKKKKWLKTQNWSKWDGVNTDKIDFDNWQVVKSDFEDKLEA